MSKPIIIGIAGGSASGKTTIAEEIRNAFSDEKSVLIIRQDDYYKDQSDMPMEERRKTNYDHPLAFDNDLLISQIHDLQHGKPIEKPNYDFVNHTRAKETTTLYPCDVLILEGLFVLEVKEIRDLLDIKVFVDTEPDIRFIRRLIRDSFVEPSKKYANIIIPEGGSNTVAVDLLITKISSIIHHGML